MGGMLRLGVDTGGTFTDFVLLGADGRLRVHKVLSTPDAPERAILQGIDDMRLDGAELQLVHGSTVATNAVLEGKGVKTLYIANRGFADLLNIGRQQRAALYDLQPPASPPTVPQGYCLETAGRIDATGRLLEPLTEDDLVSLVETRPSRSGSPQRCRMGYSCLCRRGCCLRSVSTSVAWRPG